ncbi:hypothetical protein BDB01DRAFT_728600 [Pilobolus umbonatus]|nr:hypothetical protein BDB01DRAFT_728600 [Pilobolus umbonatus]
MKSNRVLTWFYNPRNVYILFHQVSFLVTGLITTLGTQWIFYHGAATGDSYLTQLAQYIGMILVGSIIPLLLKNKKKGYNKVSQEDDDIHMVQISADTDHQPGEHYQEGPIHHLSVMKLAILDVFANFCVTLGFSIVGSGWFAICGTSAGLAISSMNNFSGSTDETKMSVLMFGTIMTLGGTFFYSCVYVYSDYLMSQYTPAPLPARICFYSGIYTSIISVIWITLYTLPRFDELIHITEGTPIGLVVGVFIMVIVGNATHSWNYYELIDRTGSVKKTRQIALSLYLTIFILNY